MSTATQNIPTNQNETQSRTLSTEEYLAAKFAKKPSNDLKTNFDYLRGWIFAALDSSPEYQDRKPINGRKNINPYPVGTINHFRFNYGMNDFYSSRTINRLTPRDTKYDAERTTYHSQPISRLPKTNKPKRPVMFWIQLHKKTTG